MATTRRVAVGVLVTLGLQRLSQSAELPADSKETLEDFAALPALPEATAIGWKLLAGAGAGIAAGLAGALFEVGAGTWDASDDPSVWKLLEAATVVAKAGGDRVENATGTVGGTASEAQGAC